MTHPYQVDSAYAINLNGSKVTLAVLEVIARKLEENGQVYVLNAHKEESLHPTLVEMWAELARRTQNAEFQEEFDT